MALYANGFSFSFENQMARIVLIDKNIENGVENAVGEIVVTADSALDLAHGILKTHNEHKEKLVALAAMQQEKANGAAHEEAVN